MRRPQSKRATAAVATLALLAALLSGARFADRAQASSLSFAPAADTYLQQSRPDSTAGTASTLQVDGKPIKDLLLKFQVSGVGSGQVSNAVLRLYAVDGSKVGGSFTLTDTNWAESTVTWRTGPAAGMAVGSLGVVSAGQWWELDVTKAIAGDGLVSFRGSSSSSDGADYASRESTNGHAPQLVISYASAATATAIPTSSPTATPAPTPTVSPTPTPLPSPSPTPSPTQGPTPAPRDPVVVAAGDIACDPSDSAFNGGAGTATACQQAATAGLIAAAAPDAVLPMGDNQYLDGTLSTYQASYDLSWGQFKSLTRPVPGNHEYQTSGAAGYYDYFGASAADRTKGYYSYDLGTWHVIALNSNCAPVGGCNAGSPQEQWLRADLAAHPAECVMAYWHHPRFSSGEHGNTLDMQTFWQDLYAAGADIVLSGHDHDYERFARQDPFGTADLMGLRQFVVGTGGKSFYGFLGIQPNSEFRQANAFGVLKLTLGTGAFTWQFVTAPDARAVDSGSETCKPAVQTDTSPPSAPTNLTSVATTPTSVALQWTASTDDTGVTAYELNRNGQPLTTLAVNSYTDTSAFPETSYTYAVRSRDAAGNWSPLSSSATVTTPAATTAPPLFADGFETGDLRAWSFSTGLTVEAEDYWSGQYAARGLTDIGATYAYRSLAATYSELYGRVHFKVISQGANPVTILKLRTATGSSVVAVYRSSSGKLSLRNDAGGITTYSATDITLGSWHEVQLRARVNGASGESEIWFDGVRIADLAVTQSLGTTPLGRLQIGESSTARVYQIILDDAAVSTTLIGG